MPQMTGDWNHNSYLLTPTSDQFDARTVPAPPSPIPVDAIKWAKGTFKIDAGSTSRGRLIFVPGVAELVVYYSLENSNVQTIFRAQGFGEAGPLKGVVYSLLGWATLDDAGSVTEVAGGILGVKGSSTPPPGDGLAGQIPGTVGYFKLSR